MLFFKLRKYMHFKSEVPTQDEIENYEHNTALETKISPYFWRDWVFWELLWGCFFFSFTVTSYASWKLYKLSTLTYSETPMILGKPLTIKVEVLGFPIVEGPTFETILLVFYFLFLVFAYFAFNIYMIIQQKKLFKTVKIYIKTKQEFEKQEFEDVWKLGIAPRETTRSFFFFK